MTLFNRFRYCSSSLYFGYCNCVIVSHHCLVLISSSLGVSARRYFVIMAYPELLHLSRNVRKRTSGHAPSEDSDQPAHSRSLIRIFTGRIFYSQGYKVSLCGQRRL